MERFGLIGHPIAHSGSPALFREYYGDAFPYDLIEGDVFEESWQRFLEGYRAINITAPFKEVAFRKVCADGMVDPSVLPIGAINIAVKGADGVIRGYNSDYLGVRAILEEKGFGKGSRVLIVGWGGAGKAAAAAARTLGCSVTVCNRTLPKQSAASSRHDRLQPAIRPLDDIPALAQETDLLIYTLPVAIPQLAGLTFPAILEANYHTPCLGPSAVISSGKSPFSGYIPGVEWLRAQARTGYPLMTGLPLQNVNN